MKKQSTAAALAPADPLEAIAQQIREEYVDLGKLCEGGVARAVRIGKLLIKAKLLIKHGEWIPWVKKHCGGLSYRQAKKWTRLARNGPHGAHLTINEALESIAAPNDVHTSSESPEWYTPKSIIARAITVLGAIDLDPCSNTGIPNVPAEEHFTSEDDGLAKLWSGRVYMNPPYGRPIDLWVQKLCDEYAAGRVKDSIALVPARTDTGWFRRLRDCAVCFVGGRLKFSEHENSAPFPSAVIYFGTNLAGFAAAYSDLGDIWVRLQ